MKQINNGFADYYYLTDNGLVYNEQSKETITPKKRHLYNLKDSEGRNRQITQRSLYKLVYNKRFCIDKIQSIEGEQWREIKDTDMIYFVSNKGRIKSYKGYEAKILKPYTNQCNYERVDIVQSGKRRSVLVHRAVAEAFLPLPDRLDMQLHHKDFNKQNNAADNLEWLTAADHIEKHTERNKKENVSC